MKKETVQTGFEECVLCEALTNVPKNMPLENRKNYIVGSGQLCFNCALRIVQKEKNN